MRRGKGRALQQDIGGVVDDLAVQAAHHTRKRHGLITVGDKCRVGAQLALLAVESGELLPIASRLDAHVVLAVGAFRKRAQIEGVQGLAQLEQNVVAHVHDVVDGTRAHGSDALDEPLGARTHLHPAYDARRVARAQLGIGHLNVHEVGHILAADRTWHLAGRLVAPRHVVDGAHLAGKPAHGQLVGAVRGNLQIEHRVARAAPLGKGHAHRRVVRQLHDALVVGAQPQLARRADHARRHDAAQLALLYLHVARQHATHAGDGHLQTRAHVRGAAHNLQRFFGAHVHGRDVHMVGVGMRLAGQNMPHDHAVERVAELLHALDAHAR